VYDIINGSGDIVDLTDGYSASRYYMVIPIGASGIAFLGDQGKFGRSQTNAFPRSRTTVRSA